MFPDRLLLDSMVFLRHNRSILGLVTVILGGGILGGGNAAFPPACNARETASVIALNGPETSRESPSRSDRPAAPADFVTMNIAGDASAAAELTSHQTERIGELVVRLDSNSPVTRRAAAGELVRLVVQSAPARRPSLVERIRKESCRGSFEARHSAGRLELKIERACREADLERIRSRLSIASTGSTRSHSKQGDPRRIRQLERSVAPHILKLWRRFSAFAGDDLASFRVFHEIARADQSLMSRDSPQVRSVDRFQACDGGHSLRQIRELVAELIAGSSDSAEEAIFFRVCGGADFGVADATRKRVMRRLVRQWLQRASRCESPVTRLRIATAYELREFVNDSSRQLLDSPGASPQRVAATLLARLTLQMPVESALMRRALTDRRVASVAFQRVRVELPGASTPGGRHQSSSRTACRTLVTQVRDVATVVALAFQGEDPRANGFVALRADRHTTYRMDSLGFTTRRERRETLGRITVDPEAGRLVIAH